MHSTNISSKGWTLDKTKSFVEDLKHRFSHSSPVKARYIRSQGKFQFVETSIEVFPTKDIDSFVEKMENEFGFTGVEYSYLNNDITSVQMTIKIKIDDNGKEIKRY